MPVRVCFWLPGRLLAHMCRYGRVQAAARYVPITSTLRSILPRLRDLVDLKQERKPQRLGLYLSRAADEAEPCGVGS